MNALDVVYALIGLWLAVPTGVILTVVARHLRDRLRESDRLMDIYRPEVAPQPPAVMAFDLAVDEALALAGCADTPPPPGLLADDDELIEALSAGDIPDDVLGRALAAWRDQTGGPA